MRAALTGLQSEFVRCGERSQHWLRRQHVGDAGLFGIRLKFGRIKSHTEPTSEIHFHIVGAHILTSSQGWKCRLRRVAV